MTTINPEFSRELQKYGAFDFNACYNCGNCTAVCSLSTEESSFPREMIRYSVLGLEDDLQASLKPWLCYYCDECSELCPKTANPGELMMSLRRWLTAKYDWTRLSGLLYKSLPLTIASFLLVAALILWLVQASHFSHEMIMHAGHTFEGVAIGVVFLAILLPNIIRMWYFTVYRSGARIPFGLYVKGAGELIIHMFTQKRSLSCENNRFRWTEHLVLVAGYLALLFTTVVLDWFGTAAKGIVWLGYAESTAVFVITCDFILDRIRKTGTVSKYSQASDWFFVIWLMLLGVSAFAVRVFIDTGMLEDHFWIYLFHLIILVQWALIIVPFGKWTHFLYRPFAVYFNSLKERAGQ